MSNLSLQEAMEQAAAAGVALSPHDYRRIEEIKETALIEALPPIKPGRLHGLIEGFNRHLPAFLRFLAGVGDTAITIIQTIAIALGLPVLLVLVLVVEHSRVKFGIGLFEVHNWLANLGGWLLVGTNTVLEFLIYHLEHKHGYQEDRAVRGSLRLYWRKLAYWSGIGRGWKEQQLSPAQRYKSLQRIVTAVILVLATAGSMTEVIQRQTGTWYQAIIDIATKSTLAQMSTWIGGLLFAIAAVLIAQVVTQYAAIRAREIMTGMNVYSQRLTPAQEAEARAAQYVLAKIASKTGNIQADNVVKSAESVPDFLAAPPVPAGMNGNGNGRTHH